MGMSNVLDVISTHFDISTNDLLCFLRGYDSHHPLTGYEGPYSGLGKRIRDDYNLQYDPFLA